jgi:hypothetical protein
VNASAVFGYGPWAFGYQTAFDTGEERFFMLYSCQKSAKILDSFYGSWIYFLSGKSTLSANNFAIGYTTKEMILHANGSDRKVRHVLHTFILKHSQNCSFSDIFQYSSHKKSTDLTD